MVNQADQLTAFINDNAILIIVVVAALVILFLVLKHTGGKKTPRKDFMKIYKEEQIKGESLNKPDKLFGLKTLWRGHELLGRIVTFSEMIYSVPKKPSDTKFESRFKDVPRKEIPVMTITFRKTWFKILNAQVYRRESDILRFTHEDEWHVQKNGRLVFPSHTPFHSLGEQYLTLNSYEWTSGVVQDQINKSLFATTNNAYAAQMERISLFEPQANLQLQIEREKIKQIEASKKLQMSNVI